MEPVHASTEREGAEASIHQERWKAEVQACGRGTLRRETLSPRKMNIGHRLDTILIQSLHPLLGTKQYSAPEKGLENWHWTHWTQYLNSPNFPSFGPFKD